MRSRLVLLVLPLVLAAPGGAAAGDDPSPGTVHAAIQRGARWLAGAHPGDLEDRTWHDTNELLALTLHHAGANLTDETYAKAIRFCETTPLRFTYRVSVLAMTLSEVNPAKYRARLAHCAQWLVDTQLEHGEWGYPGSIQGRGRQPYPAKVAPPEGDEIVRREERPTFQGEHGDFSNTQFAILGLRACRDAGIAIPKETWKAALGYLRKTQRPDGGWGYHYAGKPDEASYASLTCAGLCSMAVCLHALGKRPARDGAIKKATRWLEKHFDAGRNTGIERSSILGPSSWQYYHLYSVERAGSVLGFKEIGDVAWYPTGARWILGQQRGDGSWEDPAGEAFGDRRQYLTIADTCFAILFLARATPPLTG